MTPTLDDSSASSTKPIHTRGALTVEEVLLAARLAPSLGWKVFVSLYWLFATIWIVYAHPVALLVVIQEGFAEARVLLAMALLLDAVVAMKLLQIWRLRRTLRRLHRERRFLFQETTGQIDESGFCTSSDDTELSTDWRQFCGHRANEMVVVLYQLYPRNYMILGRSKFTSDTDWLRAVALVAEKLPRL